MDDSHSNEPRISELSSKQRRVIGVLVEKGFTTPAYYPLTLKAVVTGCNQSSNRDPVVTYSEDDAEETLNELREMGLVAEVHTDSGRSARYRHYMRKRFDFTEPQLAVLIELLLRGRQTLGNLRSRASRMVTIDSLDQLRQELTGLMEQGYVTANGPLERRGIEVDHNLYPPSQRPQPSAAHAADEVVERTSGGATSTPVEPAAAATPAVPPEQVTELTAALAELKLDNTSLRRELDELREQVNQLREQFGQLRYELGES